MEEEKTKALEKFQGVYTIEDKLATRNLVPGQSVYGEKLIQINDTEYRLWNPKRSKLAAAIINGLTKLPFGKDSKMLYLGAASGTTTSHVSDIITEGIVYCLEFSKRAFRDLLSTCRLRENTIPILGDATKPQNYSTLLDEVDIIYQDVAQPNQTEILLQNSNYYLMEGGNVIIALKAKSIDVAEKPDVIFKRETKKLKENFKIKNTIELMPYEKDHIMLLLEFKGY
jgi:fibrillarin-like pre-rRNA processing protein